MGCFSLRSLLLAAIVISNCITWTASRHSYTHNVSGHRRRHRRQGAGQYLPNSYVIPGGEGSEKGWGPWSEPASCSRTCGGGVASQKRICLTLGSGANCTGGDTKYFSCNTQECPSPSDFRAEQCAEFNDVAFKSIKYSWVPYTNGPRQCELNCMPKGERFYYRQAAKVKDGTRCSDESFDVCVDGTCQRVGCDMMLGSDARADKCQQCRGNGTNCYTNADIIDKQDYTQGYTDILLIPEGAMNIIIEEIDKSNNYLALRSKEDGKYYLNGDYQISFPHKLQIAGVLWHYERSVQGFAAPDKLRSLGPINESLYLSLLTQEPNVGIKYEYSILGDKSTPPTNQNYTWSHEQFSPCSVTCGTGFQTRNVTCRTSDDLEVVDDSLCEPGMRPIANETCQLAECMPEWVPSPWGPCSKLCGTGGSQSRSVQCQKIISNGYPSIVDENQCFRRLGDKPEEHQKCNVNVSCPTWFTGPWKPCDKLCGDGKQTRQVVCHRKTDGRVEVLVDESCEDVKPDTEQPCNIHPCDGIDWVVSNWTGCDSCVSKYYTREALCVTKDRQVVKPELCSYHRKPELQKPCNESELPPCDPQWYATQWSNCSVDCGVGVKTRKVFCGFLDNGAVLEVEDSKCNAEEKYNDTTPCEVPDHNCPARWYAATWSECTKECDGGDQFRKVMCLSGGSNPVCPEADMPDEEQSCNREPCNIDELLSVSSTTVMDDDDLPDCEEEDEEVGAELLTSTSLSDMMFSDASSVTEGSGSTETEFDFSSFSTVTGSDITEEGSGETEFTTESTGSESTVSTEETDSTVSSATGETSTASDVTGESTETSVSDLTEDTDSTVSGETTTAGSTVTGESTIASSTVAGETASSGSTVAGETTSSGSTVAGETTTPGSTVSGETTVSGSTTVSSSGSTESSSSTSEGSSTTPSSGSTGTSSSGATDSEAGTTGSTVSGATSDSTTDASTDLTSPSSSTETTSSELTSPSSSTSESTSDSTGSTDASTTVSGDTSPSESSTSDGTTTSGSEETATPSGTTTKDSDKTTTPSGSTTTDSGKTTTPGGSTDKVSGETTTPSGSTAEDSGETTTSSGSTAEDSGKTTTPGGSTTTPSGPTVSDDGVSTTTISTGTDDISSTIESSTFSGSTETEAGGSSLSTVEGVSGSTTEYSSTATGGETTTSGSTGSDSTTESGATEGTTGTETGSTDSSTQGSSTFETESGETTSWDLSTVLSTKTSRCRPRNKPAKCKTSKFGCCPDKKTPAGGPFDEGCPSPTTCKDTKYGCCPDGVSPAGGPRNRDCPVPNCKETLYGCCKSDRKTPAEGNDQEGCPPACKFSKHGCCADNETQATGPNHAGCPETSTTTTESPTETTTDSDVSSEPGFTDSTEETAAETTTTETSTEAVTEKCEIINGTEVCHPCSTTEFGCCDDGETAAHGANKLGCCLLTPHGCCPDNYQAATGPNLEGCDCKNAPFGCCPDQKSYASGPNNTGCGCEHSTHGCCPDRHTEATGPDFEGCSCHTYQFGCCPDGKTAAVGFNLQGCRCEESKHGCCGDGVTPATGPNQEGCDCASSKFGCCPDGVTESKSKNFTGCAEALVNRQAACGLPYEQGSCTNYSIQWFYDNDYGGCSRFHYGGCEGNGNRFASKEECTDVCIQPAPRDACHLPKVKGSCTKEVVVRWYYDDNYQRCLQFHYSNCLGNANNFKTQEECDKQCSPKLDEEGQCQLPIDEGPCAGNYSRWGYNETTQRCEEFLWGGCQGNPNRFSSEAACMLKCNPPGKKQPVCDQPQDAGNCTQNNPYWAFNKNENRCVPFYYGGCGGNENRFSDQKQCEDACPKSFEKDKCTLPASPGDCRQFQLRWFFDTKHKQCRQFPYGGCGGNDNNFLSEDLCKSECSRTTTPPPAPTQDTCSLPPEVGPCRAAHLRYYFNPSTRRCDPFTYGGCEGNQNNFHSVQECEQRCAPPPATPPPNIPPECRVGSLEECRGVGRLWYLEPSSGRCTPYDPQPGAPSCSLPGIFSSPEACERACGDFRDIDPCKLRPSAGNCSDTVESWYYDEERDQCGEFYYTGCGGNENRFPSKEECEGRCKVGAEPEPQCRTPESLQPCGEPRAAFHYDHAAGRCVQSEIGGCNHPNKYSTEEECLRSCGDFKGIDVCREPLHPGSCRQPTQKFYWNLREGRCDSYTYSGCEGGANRFSNEAECQQVCGHLAIDPSENEVADCDAARAECAALRCDYGTSKTRDANGCDRCTCITHPCETLQCPADQRCVVNVEYDAATGSTQYVGDCGVVEKPGTCPAAAEEDSSACHVECNDDADCRGADKCCGSGCSRLCRAPDAVNVPADCSAEKARCSSLQCELSVQKTRGPDGCEHCECVRPEPNCQPFADECRALKCNYGPISRTTDADGCERCTCIAHPCEGKRCPEGQRCTVTASYDGPSGSTQYTGDCAIVNKPGTCPAEQAALSTCHVECNDDADCRGVQKCCSSGCSRLCRAPAGPENAVRGPLVPQAPEPNTETEHEVSSSEGGMATLRCLFHSNPPPRITWRKGEITIDGNQGRFRLTSDGALQIVSLYRNDTGVYICVAENELGTSEQEIELRVDGPVEAPAGIVGESESEVVGDIGQGLRVRCLAYGFPTPTIAWHHRPTGEMVPYDSSKYEARGNELLIKSLGLDTLGEYTCQVYNGLGKPVSWQVTVRAAHADASWPSSPYLVQRGAPPPARTEPPAAPPARDYSPYVEIPAVPPQFTVPVRTSIQAQQTALATGGRLELSCDVDGHPEPRVFWTKDNVQLAESDRIYFTPARLSISRLVEEDAGVYGCHADNGHSAHHSVVQISVQKLYIPELCKDNQYFADCKLIVRSNLCRHEYYSKFCCKSCVEANALDPQTLEFQGDSAWTYKKK